MAIDPAQDFKSFVYWASYLYFVAAPALAVLALRGRGALRTLSTLALVATTALAWARFVEPRLLTVKAHQATLGRCFAEAGSVRFAVVSDLHLGIFGNAMPASRVAARIRSLNVDAALIAGDFTYWIDPGRFRAAFGPLGAAGAPVFAVLGNHDVGRPGPPFAAALAADLKSIGLRMIDDEAVRFDGPRGRIDIVGLSDLWLGRPDLSLLTQESVAPRVVLAHNPETAWVLSGRWTTEEAQAPKRRPPVAAPDAARPPLHADLIVSGHTHGGQIYIPFVTCRLIAIACSPLRYGLGAVDGRLVFVTSGTGMVGLPMRFAVPPRIDILTVAWRRCEDHAE